MDMHFWLDPMNAKHMVAQIAATLRRPTPTTHSPTPPTPPPSPIVSMS